MFYYIERNNKIGQTAEKPTENSGYNFSKEITDLGKKRIELNEEQAHFYLQNPEASALEVFNMKLNEPLSVERTPEELRKEAYAIQHVIAWENESITVDQANGLYLSYFAEGNNDIAGQLQELICQAKEKIREEIKTSGQGDE